jgi:hypothetical protein
MQFDATVFRANDDLAVVGIDGECRSEWEACRIDPNNLALAELVESLTSHASRMI